MVKLNKIYTRTGDDGTTGLVDGARAKKHSARIAAIGDVDEANSVIGLASGSLHGSGHDRSISRIQNDLFDLGADLATPLGEFGSEDFEPTEMVLRVVAAQVDWLENAIDDMNANLEPLTSFILPGGTEAAARAHIARSVVRRAERSVTALADAEPVNPQAIAYINRLSDYFFVLARVLNDNGAADVQWVPGANR
ncbi:cob(I)yrinic acid a,c-diamide adenosyltransferase [Pontixanthobacter sp. CEM42]|uniref:cob(I)yrinic acid a,c-diamide adenosyltransferase n=1 Tax=Pontixanthobacter sp. CEM42 TaxID=2792077 RepID=UPI001ADFAEB9